MMSGLFFRKRTANAKSPAMSPSYDGRACRRRQRGVVLFIALIVLVAMTLAGIALVRSVDTGTMVAGNLAFKQGATMAGDAGTDAAIAFLTPLNGTTTPYQNQIISGYYATSQDSLDITGSRNDPTRARVDWDNNNCSGIVFSACIKPSPAITDAATGTTIRYIIHRLCQGEGDPNAISNV
jgi:type IV pilus assembly protein PilX